MGTIRVDEVQANSILIADDSKQILALHAKFAQIASPGIEIQTAPDGNTAWELFQKKPTAIAMLDIQMPGIDGVKLAEKIYRHSPPTGIIILSCNLTQNLMLKFATLDVDFAAKPVSQYDVTVKIRMALRQFEKEVELQKLRVCARLTSSLNSKLFPLSTITFLRDLAEDPKSIDKLELLRQAMDAGLDMTKFFSDSNGHSS